MTMYYDWLGPWYQLDQGVVFTRWIPKDMNDRYEIGDSISIWTFSGMSENGQNYENRNVEMARAST